MTDHINVESSGARPEVFQLQAQAFIDVTPERGFGPAGCTLVLSPSGALIADTHARVHVPFGTLLLYVTPESAQHVRPVAKGAEPQLTVFLDFTPENGFPGDVDVMIMQPGAVTHAGVLPLKVGSMLFRVDKVTAENMRAAHRKQVAEMRRALVSRRLATGRPD